MIFRKNRFTNFRRTTGQNLRKDKIMINLSEKENKINDNEK